ncbi:MAG: ComEC/Rec2 family competence protein [Demequina sp.]
MSTVHDARLVPAACVAWVAALVSTAGPGPSHVLVLVIVGLGVALGAHAVRAQSRAAGSLGLLCVVAAGVSLVASAQVTSAASQGSALLDAGDTEAWISVTGDPARMAGWDGAERYRVAARVTAWRSHCREPPSCAQWRPSDAPVVVSLANRPQRGDSLHVTATWVESDRGPATAVAWRADTVGDAPPSFLVRWRADFAQATAVLGETSRGLVRGMVVGDTSSMSPSQVQDMRVSGLAHLTAVSGAHFAIVIMACGAAMSALRAPRPVRATAIFIVASTFAALVGAESSVLRALGMAVAVALAAAWGRPARGLAALAACVVVLLTIDPALSRSLGFAMSVQAVAAIVLWSPRIAVLLARVVTPGLARVASIPIAAQVAVTPVLVVIEPRLGPYAVVANLAAGVAVLPTMLAGAMALAIAAVHVEAAQVPAHVAGVGAAAIVSVARTAASAPGSWLSWPAGTLGVCAAAAVAVGLVAATTATHPSRRVAAVVVACAVTGAALSIAGGTDRPVMRDWDVAVCDVGQGDMLLLRAGPDAAVVIDTGPPGGGASECLRRHGVARVPVLVLTHPHQDHDGAVVSVLGSTRVDRAWVAAAGAKAAAARVLEAAGVPVEVPAPGQHERVGELSLTVVSEAHARPQVELNDASIVVYAVAGQTAVLALGDLEQRGQRELLALMPSDLHVDVVKVAHHGSADQLPALAARIDATVAVVTAGEENRHGHPTETALDLYGTTSQALLRTDVCGDVAIGTVEGLLTWSGCPTDVAR